MLLQPAGSARAACVGKSTLRPSTLAAPCLLCRPSPSSRSSKQLPHQWRSSSSVLLPSSPPSTAAARAAVTGLDVQPLEELAALQAPHNVLLDGAEGLETPIQLMYLLVLLAFLSVGAFLVVRQVLIRRELDEAAKGLGERIRTGEASCEDYYELGVILTRKKLYTQATKNLEKAKKLWDGEETELAQVHNALGYCYTNMDRADMAAEEYRRAVALQPGYVTAWNNLGDACEKNKQWREALNAYQEAVSYAPNNTIALQRSAFCKEKLDRLSTTSL